MLADQSLSPCQEGVLGSPVITDSILRGLLDLSFLCRQNDMVG